MPSHPAFGSRVPTSRIMRSGGERKSTTMAEYAAQAEYRTPINAMLVVQLMRPTEICAPAPTGGTELSGASKRDATVMPPSVRSGGI